MAFRKLDPKAFAGTGLDFSERERKPRIICAVDGRDKTGKSHFCYDAPDPIAVLSFDFGDEDVVQKFTEMGRQIGIVDLKWDIPDEMRNTAGTIDKAKSDALGKWVDDKVWKPFVQTTKKIIASGQIRTVVVDKATEAWQVCRLAVYGRLASNRQDLQTEANARWREYVRLFASCDLPVNLMLIHEQKDEWVSKKVEGRDGTPEEKWFRSGKSVRDGNEKVPYLIQTGLEMRYVAPKKHPVQKDRVLEDGKFECEVMVNRGAPEVVGTVFDNPGWLEVISACRPAVPIEDWGHATMREE